MPMVLFTDGYYIVSRPLSYGAAVLTKYITSRFLATTVHYSTFLEADHQLSFLPSCLDLVSVSPPTD